MIGALLVALAIGMLPSALVSAATKDGMGLHWVGSILLTLFSGFGLFFATVSSRSDRLQIETRDALAVLGRSLRRMQFREHPAHITVAQAVKRVVGLLRLVTDPGDELRRSEAFAVVSFGWVAMSVFGAIPFLLSGTIPSTTDAFFETMSGFTTTGASILREIESLPSSILFWRSFTHWIGGMGIIVLSLAILPFLGVGGMQLFRAEVPGPTPDRLQPRIKETAKLLWGVYFALTFLQILLLMAANMPWLDACCHAFGTLGTGGFSTKNASIGAYPSYAIQWIIILFMFLAGANFTLHFQAIRGRTWREHWRDFEFRAYTLITLLAVTVTTLVLLWDDPFSGPLQALTASAFTVISLGTSTGYATVDYQIWPIFLHALLLVLMFVGGCAGSTGGGFKTVRAILMVRFTRIELRRLLHPRAIINVRYGNRRVQDSVIQNVLGFFLLYISFLALGTLLLAALGIDLVTAGSASLACLSNIGPGLADVGPTANYAWMPGSAKWLLSFWMLLGRLEIYTVLILFAPELWKR
jgi:trk system potassium uptake protein TrkH